MAAKKRDRLDWIILRGGLTLLAAGGALVVPLVLLTALRSDSLSWDGDVGFSTELPAKLVTPADGASLMFDGHVQVLVSDPTLRLSLLAAAPDILLAAAISYVAWVLLLVVLNVHAGESFSGRVPRLLATVGPVIAAATIALTFLRAYANHEIMSAAVGTQEYFPIDDGGFFNPALGRMIAWLFVALFVSVIARAFAEGRRLADDAEGLI